MDKGEKRRGRVQRSLAQRDGFKLLCLFARVIYLYLQLLEWLEIARPHVTAIDGSLRKIEDLWLRYVCLLKCGSFRRFFFVSVSALIFHLRICICVNKHCKQNDVDLILKFFYLNNAPKILYAIKWYLLLKRCYLKENAFLANEILFYDNKNKA